MAKLMTHQRSNSLSIGLSLGSSVLSILFIIDGYPNFYHMVDDPLVYPSVSYCSYFSKFLLQLSPSPENIKTQHQIH